MAATSTFFKFLPIFPTSCQDLMTEMYKKNSPNLQLSFYLVYTNHVIAVTLHAQFHDWDLYPDSSFQSDSDLSQGGTDSCVHADCGLHPDSGF